MSNECLTGQCDGPESYLTGFLGKDNGPCWMCRIRMISTLGDAGEIYKVANEYSED